VFGKKNNFPYPLPALGQKKEKDYLCIGISILPPPFFLNPFAA
jgi:hypothetical protein